MANGIQRVSKRKSHKWKRFVYVHIYRYLYIKYAYRVSISIRKQRVLECKEKKKRTKTDGINNSAEKKDKKPESKPL